LYFRFMEIVQKNESVRVPADGGDQPGVARPWVKNLLEGQGFSLPEKVQFWWSVHLEAFLRYARKRGPAIQLDQLVSDYLTGLRLEEPPIPAWRVEQNRMALDVFARGIEHWHWETDSRGRPLPRFRLKCAVEIAPENVSFGAQRGKLPALGQPQRTQPSAAAMEWQPARFQHDEANAGKGTVTPAQSLPTPHCPLTDAAPKDVDEAIERLRREIRLAHYSWRTEQSYTEAVAGFLKYFPGEKPAELTDAHVKS
jgi:hypothetical protein